ncbi:DUF6602 domain-containing protein [Acidithiobacillus sp.]
MGRRKPKTKTDIESALHLRDAARENNHTPTGEPLILSVGGVLHCFNYDSDLFLGDRLSQRLRSEQGWFEKLVAHAPSVGTFYEDALRAIVADILPSGLKLGTGFIFDSTTRRYSKQIDILIYDDSTLAPFYRRGQFVVVSPEQVVSASEVKKSLKLNDVRNIISSTINSNFGRHPDDPPGCQRIYVFSYSSRVSTKSIIKCIATEISNYIATLYKDPQSEDGRMDCISSLVLPRFFFFDRAEDVSVYISNDEEEKCRLVVSENSGGANDGLGSYLDAMVVQRTKKADIDRRTFFSIPIENFNKQVIIPHQVPIMQKVSMLSLCELFPNERENIINFCLGGKQPYMALLPPCCDVTEFRSFAELTSDTRIGWAIPLFEMNGETDR